MLRLASRMQVVRVAVEAAERRRRVRGPRRRLHPLQSQARSRKRKRVNLTLKPRAKCQTKSKCKRVKKKVEINLLVSGEHVVRYASLSEFFAAAELHCDVRDSKTIARLVVWGGTTDPLTGYSRS